MNMFKKGMLLFCIWFCTGTLWGENVPEQTLAQKIQQAPQAGLKRFNYLRFYVPSNTIPVKPGLWKRWFSSKIEQEHQRALAFYLFNMYVTTHSYKQPTPTTILTLNDLGVLDGFMLCAEPFDFKNATTFYQKNKSQVHAWLKRFFSGHSFPWPRPAPQDYERWVKLLAKQPQRHCQAAYTWPLPNLLYSSVAQDIAAAFIPVLEKAHQEGQQKVVLYDEPAANLEDLDSHLGPKKMNRKRTYRRVVDECNYMSYLVAKTLTQAVLNHPQTGRSTRIYTLTAYPAKAEFLTPSQGTRFKLANGENGLAWRYHTAVLAVVPENGFYVPVILDTFLGGMQPLSVQEWLSHFSANTVFTAAPFRPSQEVENALRTPEKINGNAVWFEGRKYIPGEVIQ